MRPLQINQNLNYEKIYLFHFDLLHSSFNLLNRMGNE